MNPILNMRAWYDELSPAEQTEIDAFRKSLGTLGFRIIPAPLSPPIADQRVPEGGLGLRESVAESARRLVTMPEPFSFIRIGDADLSLLSGGFPIPRQGGASLDKELWFNGTDRGVFRYRGEMIEAVRSASLLGLMQFWPGVTENFATVFSLIGFPLPVPNAVEFGALAGALVLQYLFPFLMDKKVVLIGDKAERLAQAWNTKKFIDAYSMFGPVDKIQVVRGFLTGGRGSGGWKRLDEITDLLRDIDFDVALIGWGTPAKILAHRICTRYGKTALDVGSVFDALAGGDAANAREREVLNWTKWPDVAF